MLPESLKNFLTSLLSQKTSIAPHSLEIKEIGGGSINHTYRLSIEPSQFYFLKSNNAASYPSLFEKEKEGLEFLASQQCIAIPTPVFCGLSGEDQFLLLEWVAPGERTEQFWKKFGEQLARLHTSSHTRFGFATDNYMGALPQMNTFTDRWTDFFIRYRILPQMEIAIQGKRLPNKYTGMFQQLFKKLDAIFNEAPPSLLHGDLWSGNFICNPRSEPVLIDPAVYYGHRSMDLAMTTLFGGFDKLFYDSYHYHMPLPGNYREQWEVCNLYPLLIHLNLFGESYLADIGNTLKKFC
jgi:protein-ribulosamine 3-kinase